MNQHGYDLGMDIQIPVLRTQLRTSQAARRKPHHIIQADQSKMMSHMFQKESKTQQTSTQGGIKLKPQSCDNTNSDAYESINRKYENQVP